MNYKSISYYCETDFLIRLKSVSITRAFAICKVPFVHLCDFHEFATNTVCVMDFNIGTILRQLISFIITSSVSVLYFMTVF